MYLSLCPAGIATYILCHKMAQIFIRRIVQEDTLYKKPTDGRSDRASFFVQEREGFRYEKEFWNTIQFIFTAVGGWLGYFLGGCDGLLYALIAFVAIDYITGCDVRRHRQEVIQRGRL